MIEREVHGDVAVLRLAHGKASALDLELLQALDEALRAEQAGAQRALVLTGSGTIFCAGVDLKRILDGGRAYVEAFLPALDRAFASLFFLEKPVVAALNGHAIAGGAVLAFACDRRILARGKGLIGMPELRVGVPFPALALEIVRATLRSDLLSSAILEGRNSSGEESLAHGLVDELVVAESLLPRALEAAAGLADTPSASFALSKRWLRRPARLAWERDASADLRAVIECWTSDACRKAIEAYVERTLRKS